MYSGYSSGMLYMVRLNLALSANVGKTKRASSHIAGGDNPRDMRDF
jgi:hypothetical protein